MKRECTVMQGKCNKMLARAMPPSHHLKSENKQNLGQFLFSFTVTVQAMRPHRWLLLRYFA